MGAGIGGLAGGAAAGKMVADGITKIETGWFGASVGTVGSYLGNKANGEPSCGCK